MPRSGKMPRLVRKGRRSRRRKAQARSSNTRAMMLPCIRLLAASPQPTSIAAAPPVCSPSRFCTRVVSPTYTQALLPVTKMNTYDVMVAEPSKRGADAGEGPHED